MSYTGAQVRPLRILQITDLHLCPQPGDVMDSGINTDDSLQRVLAQVKQQEPHLDRVLVTGDLVHEPVPEAYQRVSRQLSPLPCPVHCLPGNHDDADLMEDTLAASNLHCGKILSLDDWLIVLLNSTVPGASHGKLDEAELELLEESLSRHPSSHALICLHHPVIPVGSPWMDRIGLCNADDFLGVIDEHDKVRGVLFGHAHQAVDRTRNGVRLLCAPSTGAQFAPRSQTPRLDDLPPGYRRLDLFPDGRIDTWVNYLPQVPEWRLCGT
ncbi:MULTISPECIES: 3',5'-cyclic-AMP phosphodiesterase [unclassified Ectothiorhodospira]|uniref:3',5'-cyclic-AMP phosphodiesterase n=1 Tax=unclassified Ectothiorhodospira TaxID=2684909 RepID=UPI001EE8D4F6|nr:MULTISPECIES: 3',5'-cyclic-AMP phosphodiesterase [unclassified Ectothiorhodospira]MCG5515633.1 3',5'-cyclic-AMP phosphodiesterase [Ectothiorhodospira sp. 9100]MCG5518843.1 3',5'-cyclic-AMP phosphodiesterase [Ectothiorhodospira sp. 9905]